MSKATSPFAPVFLATLNLCAVAFGQGDPLASKSLPLLLADQGRLYAFAADGVKHSRIDLFTDPVAIRSGTLPFKAGVRGGVGRRASVLVFLNFRPTDTSTVGGIASVDRDGKTSIDSITFRRSTGRNNAVNSGVEISALALRRDTALVGGGRAGFAYARPRSGGAGVLAADSLHFLSLPFGEDTAVSLIRCGLNAACRVDSLSNLTAAKGEPDSVTTLAVDSSSADSAWVLIGTQTGLRRGLWGGTAFPKVALPGDTASRTRIERIHADPARRILWVFTGSRVYFSDDHGATFRVPPDIAGLATRPSVDLKGFDPAPTATNIGDTSYINFNLDLPGLVLFRRDTLLANVGSGAPADVLLDAADGLEINRGLGKLTDLAVVRGGNSTALVVGTTSKGFFYRITTNGNTGAWANLNSLKRLSGGLEEIITYPTLFTGNGPTGEPEYVNIGYRLKESGKVTITVYNYNMEKVKVLVRNAPRKGGGGRSEDPSEDRWDGRDRSGRLVSVGTYYILVESSQGEKGWGKAIAVRGRN